MLAKSLSKTNIREKSTLHFNIFNNEEVMATAVTFFEKNILTRIYKTIIEKNYTKVLSAKNYTNLSKYVIIDTDIYAQNMHKFILEIFLYTILKGR